MTPTAPREAITLGGGCFWCLQPIFEAVTGVERVVVGYAGGSVPHPTYKQVCTDTTGHAEVVQVIFDPERVDRETLLEVFFSVHDPTTLNRQGPDVGTQYRSAVFYHSPEQKAAAERVIAKVTEAGLWNGVVVTEVTPLDTFYPAEEYHQHYFERNPHQAYCRVHVAPKVAKFRKRFAHLLTA